MKRIKIAFFGCSLLFLSTATAQTTDNKHQSVKQGAGPVTYSKAGMLSAQAKNKPAEMYHAKSNQLNHGAHYAPVKAVVVDAHRLKKIEAVNKSIKARKQ